MASDCNGSPRLGQPSEPEHFRVGIRVRPLNRKERASSENVIISEDPHSGKIQVETGPKKATEYIYDYALPKEASQQMVFDALRLGGIVEKAMYGYSATVFAYGQTGTGKTFTMFGDENALRRKECRVTDDSNGVIVQAASFLFDRIRRDKSSTYTLRVTCVEVYNEQVYDLLSLQRTPKQVREHESQGFYVDKVTVVQVNTVEGILRIVQNAVRNRKVASHDMNSSSNRSHCLLSLFVTSKSAEGIVKHGKLKFVDLAGSERASQTATSGATLRESGHINKSLHTLTLVIDALSSGRAGKFAPFRDSKLTKLLQDSLGINSFTTMIACISPSASAMTETLRTLQFAANVGKITSTPIVILDEKEKLIQSLQEKIRQLRKENTILRRRGPVLGPFASETSPMVLTQDDLELERQIVQRKAHMRKSSIRRTKSTGQELKRPRRRHSKASKLPVVGKSNSHPLEGVRRRSRFSVKPRQLGKRASASSLPRLGYTADSGNHMLGNSSRGEACHVQLSGRSTGALEECEYASTSTTENYQGSVEEDDPSLEVEDDGADEERRLESLLMQLLKGDGTESRDQELLLGQAEEIHETSIHDCTRPEMENLTTVVGEDDEERSELLISQLIGSIGAL